MPRMLISGGQTGVDRASLDAALELGLLDFAAARESEAPVIYQQVKELLQRLLVPLALS